MNKQIFHLCDIVSVMKKSSGNIRCVSVIKIFFTIDKPPAPNDINQLEVIKSQCLCEAAHPASRQGN